MTLDHRRIDDLLAAAREAQRIGDDRNALDLLHHLLDLVPFEPRALNILGNYAIRDGDFTAARDLFARAAASDAAPPVLLNLAIALGGLGEIDAELTAIEDALKIDPYFQPAFLQRARWMERHANRHAAVAAYRNWLNTIHPDAQVGDRMREAVTRGQALIAEDAAILRERILRHVGGDPASGRVSECVDILLGAKRVFTPQPSGLHFPFLPAVPFFDRTLFPWFSRLESATKVIARELLAVLSADVGLEPYVTIAEGQPLNQWEALNHSRAWSAFFLWRDGEPVEENILRCPATAKLLENIPLLDLAGRGPTVMFSILKPHTIIPPHTGVTNIRSVVHLPLIVPQGCGFRVGSTAREWKIGEAWAFDDSIEHEAWNDSSGPRAILILDVWNPYLELRERAQLRHLTRAMDEHAAYRE